jgi:murein DD-endopeptidase MepM/ murein hydrolase activator NlpD
MIFKAGYRRKIWLVFIPVLLSYFVLLIFSLSCLASYKYHTVKKGDTLYKISRLYGVTVDEIRRTNHLGSEARIYPGQELRIPLSEKDGVYHEVKRHQTLWRIAKTYNVPMEEIIRANNLSSTEIKVGQSLFIPGAKKVLEIEIPDELLSKGKASPQISASEAPVIETKREPVEFSWPVEGEILRYFGEEGNRGIDIAAAGGSLIVAPAEGVVYFNGWLGTDGRTLVIYHEKEDLYTCYMHNSIHLVEKDDRVKKGQPIAQVGNTGVVESPCLHFEVRKELKPVNPLDYLP